MSITTNGVSLNFGNFSSNLPSILPRTPKEAVELKMSVIFLNVGCDLGGGGGGRRRKIPFPDGPL